MANTRKTALKNKVKGKLKAWVSAGSPNDNYGFGSNWNLNIGQKDKVLKTMWLGQGGKVTSRMLGADYGNYVKDVSQRAGTKKKFNSEADWLKNKKVNKQVTGDILHASFGDEWMGDGWSGTNDSKRLKKLLGAEAWGLAVQ